MNVLEPASALLSETMTPVERSAPVAWHTTKVETQAGEVYDLGRGQYPPVHVHAGGRACDACFVIDTWTELESLKAITLDEAAWDDTGRGDRKVA